MSKFDKLADFLAERYVAVQEAKTAEEEKTNWNRFRPENPERPGANWWTGLGGGALAAGLETGVGEHGLTDSVQRYFDRRNLQKNPLGQFNTPEFKASITGNEQAKFLHDLFNRQGVDTAGKKAIGQLLSRNYGTVNVGDRGEVKRLYREIKKIVGSGDTEMARRFGELTSKSHPRNAERGRKVVLGLDELLSGRLGQKNPQLQLNPAETNLITKLRTSIKGFETAEDLDKLTRDLQNLASTVKGGKKGAPQTFAMNPALRQYLNLLSAAPVTPDKVRDTNKVKDLVTSLGQFTKGRNVPTFLRRLRRGGTAAGIGTVAGAYALPSLIDFGKWALGRGEQQGAN